MPFWWMFVVGGIVGFVLGVVASGAALWLLADWPDELKPDPLRSDQR